MTTFKKDKQFIKFCTYGFLKNLRFYDIFLLLFFLENGISYSQVGILYAVREIVVNISEIPTGIIADTYGRKRSLIIALLAYIISFVVFYYSTSFPLLLLAMILYGTGDAFRSGSHKGMIMDYLKINSWEHLKTEYYGYTRSWSQNGSAISALFAGFLVLYSGSYRIIYLFALIPYVFNLINIATYPEILNRSRNSSDKPGVESLVQVFKNFIRVTKNRAVLQIINSAALHSAFLKAIKDYIQPVMIHVAILIPLMKTFDEKSKNGFLIGIMYFLIYIMTSRASKHASKLKELNLKNIPKMTLLLGLSSGIICGILMTYQYWILSLVLFVFIYIIENLRKPILTATLSDNIPNEILASAFSAQSSYSTFVTACIAVLFGFLADKIGIGISMMTISALLILLVLIIGSPKMEKMEKMV